MEKRESSAQEAWKNKRIESIKLIDAPQGVKEELVKAIISEDKKKFAQITQRENLGEIIGKLRWSEEGNLSLFDAPWFATSWTNGESAKDASRLKFITFHPSYSYEEFVEGITVDTSQGSQEHKSGEIRYLRKPGIFKRICTAALAQAIGEKTDPGVDGDQWSRIYAKYVEKTKNKQATMDAVWKSADRFVLIIDEINRGDVSKILGELVTLLESDKRLGQENELTVQLPYSNDVFGVPPNVYIIGTMNTADRSIALVDIALRRRFGFVETPPDFKAVRTEHIEKNREMLQDNQVYEYLVKSVDAIEKINGRIIDSLGRDKQIGHSFLFKVFDQKGLMRMWQYELLPLLEEYYYCDYEKITKTLGLQAKNIYVNKDEGIKGFNGIAELDQFLNAILKAAGT
ncbi:MAG: AAA family ATPase [Candidatus Bathyarchaeia archaeon]